MLPIWCVKVCRRLIVIVSTEKRGLESFPSNDDGGGATTDMADVTSATAAQGRASILINIFLTS